MSKYFSRGRRFARTLGHILADAYLGSDGHSPASHPPDMYRNHLTHSVNWIR